MITIFMMMNRLRTMSEIWNSEDGRLDGDDDASDVMISEL